MFHRGLVKGRAEAESKPATFHNVNGGTEPSWPEIADHKSETETTFCEDMLRRCECGGEAKHACAGFSGAVAPSSCRQF